MINPLAISTRGRISQQPRRTLTLGTVGRIFIGSTPPVPSVTDYGGGSSARITVPAKSKKEKPKVTLITISGDAEGKTFNQQRRKRSDIKIEVNNVSTVNENSIKVIIDV